MSGASSSRQQSELQQISQLRQETRQLIANLYAAASDKETFESVLGPVKGGGSRSGTGISNLDEDEDEAASRRPRSRTPMSQYLQQQIQQTETTTASLQQSSSIAHHQSVRGSMARKSLKLKEVLAQGKEKYAASASGQGKVKVIGVIQRPGSGTLDRRRSRDTASVLTPFTLSKEKRSTQQKAQKPAVPRNNNISLLSEKDDIFFQDLQEFRKLYQEKFMRSALDDLDAIRRRGSARIGAGSVHRGTSEFGESVTGGGASPAPSSSYYISQPSRPGTPSIPAMQPMPLPGASERTTPPPPIDLTLDSYTAGYFRVDENLVIFKHHQSAAFQNMDDLEDDGQISSMSSGRRLTRLEEEGEGAKRLDMPCKVSIPAGTFMNLVKKYVPKTTRTYENVQDSVNIADHLHAAFIPCLWSGLAIRAPSASMSIEQDCITNLRIEKLKLVKQRGLQALKEAKLIARRGKTQHI